MAVVFPHDQLKIMDYNRVVKDLNGLSQEEFLAKVGEKFEVAPADAPRTPGARHLRHVPGRHVVPAQGQAGLLPRQRSRRGLDVSILQDNLLAPILGIARSPHGQAHRLRGRHPRHGRAGKRVKEGWAVAFSLYPTSLDQLMAVADAGQIMPPKSTWFEPKLRSGLLVRIYED